MSNRTYRVGLALLVAGVSSVSQAATLLGKWDFNEGSGNSGLDSSGNGNNASLVNGPGYVSTGAGNYGAQLVATSSQYIDYGTSALFDLTGPLSLESWFTLESLSAATGEPLIFGKDTTLFGTTVWNGNAHNYLAGGSNDVLGPVPITLGHRFHLVDTWDGATLSVYVDGALIGTKSVAATPAPNLTVSLLSGSCGPSNPAGYLNMIMDEARIYSGALTAQDVAANFAAGPTVVPEPASMAFLTVATALFFCRRANKH